MNLPSGTGPLEQTSPGHLSVVKFKTFESSLSRKFDRFLPTERPAGNTVTLRQLSLKHSRTAERGIGRPRGALGQQTSVI